MNVITFYASYGLYPDRRRVWICSICSRSDVDMGLDERIEYDLHTTNLLRSGRETLFLRQIVSMEYIFTIIRHSFYCNFNAIFGG